MEHPAKSEADNGHKIPHDPRRDARSLYWRGWSVQQISKELSLPYTTVASWKGRNKWDDASPDQKIDDGLERRYLTLIEKENKSGKDFKEIDLIQRQREKQARIAKYNQTGKEADLNPNIERRNDEKAVAKRAEKRKNFLTDEQWDLLEEDFHASNFGHQADFWAQRDQRTRKYLKSRQVGATWYFSREALMKARESRLNGEPRNQIFLSASKRQALKFRQFIVAWVRKVTGVVLTGDPMIIDMGDGAEPVGFYFLSTNKDTAQSESGDLYFDEFFWVYGFTVLRKVAGAMATHSIYKRTYFSTPSTITHQAHGFWSGDEWNKGRAKADQQKFDISKRHLGKGAMMPDGSWCQIVDVNQAVAGGMGHLLNVDELRMENSDDEFRNLYECEFIDDAASSFPHNVIRKAMVDSFYNWRDFSPAEYRPYGHNPVWIGYDPNKAGRDDAALAVVAPPSAQGGKFRILEKLRLNGLDFQGQDDAIRRVAARYNVTDISIDTTGVGAAVHELVKLWFPMVRAVHYNVAVKTALVLKGKNIFSTGRIEFDAGWSDVAAAFMAIRPHVTSGGTVTYTARRDGDIGHADVAWAILHALSNEPMSAALAGTGGGTVIFFDD